MNASGNAYNLVVINGGGARIEGPIALELSEAGIPVELFYEFVSTQQLF